MSAATADANPHEVKHRGLITVSIMLATIMQVLDTTIANVALPHMQGSLSAAQDTITWVLTSYIVAAAIATPITGWFSGYFGLKKLFLICVAGFTVTSMMCGLATSLEQMVLYRVLQGLFGAALVPLSQTTLLNINPKEKHGQAMALWGAGIMVGPIAGPTLGGWLTETFDWRWVFFVNLPVGILAFLGILAFMPGSDPQKRRFDFFGFAMLSLGLGALQMLLDRGEQKDWFGSPEIWIEACLAVTGFWVFLVHILTAKDTFIDARIFRDRNFSTGLIFIFVVGIVLLATTALLPPMLQSIYGYPVVTTGLVLAPRGIGTMISMILVGRLMGRIDPRIMVALGIILTAWSLWDMTGFTPQMDYWPLITSGVIQGLGLGMVFVPLSTVAFSTLPVHYRTDATALFSLVRNVGSAVGISIVATLLSQNTQVNHAELVQHITPFTEGLSMDVMAGDPAALSQLNQQVTLQASLIAYINDFLFMMWVTLAALPLIFLLRYRKAPQSQGPGAAAAALE